MKQREKVYIIRKVITAPDLVTALKKEKDYKPEECYLEETSFKQLVEDKLIQ